MKYFLLSFAFVCAPLFGAVNVRSFGAVGNGSHDDTAAFNAAFQQGCATSSPIYIPTGLYMVEPLNPISGCNSTIYGDGATKTTVRFRSGLNAGTWQALWSFNNGSTLSLLNLGLDGRSAGLAGLSINGYSSVALTGVYIHNFGTPGYAQGHRSPFDGLYLINSENVTIQSSIFIENERAGVELQAVHDSIVSNSVMSWNGGMGGVSEQNFDGPLDGPLQAQWLNNTLQNNGSGGIDTETDPGLTAVEAIMTGNHVMNCGNNNWGSGWGLVIGMHAFGKIQGNEVDNYAAKVPVTSYSNAIVYGSNGGAIEIASNVVKGTANFGILGSSGLFPVSITGNNLTANGTGIFIYDSPSVQITSNTAFGNRGPGIAVYWSDNSSISGNQLSSNRPNLIVNGQAANQ